MVTKTTNILPEIRKTIVLKASIEKVWNAIATSEGLAAWWMPNTFKPVLGQEFILHAREFGDSPCKVTELEPPIKIGFDWDNDWHIVFILKKLDENETEFTLIHSGWDERKLTKFGQSHTDIRKVMDSGWEKLIKIQLPKYVEV